MVPKDKTLCCDQQEFMKLITNVEDSTYLTHNYHPWAAKFIPQIPRYFIDKYSKPNDLIFDPFCGSGTTLVEAILAHRNGIGNDLNYIASLISKAKTKPLNSNQIEIITKWKNQLNLR